MNYLKIIQYINNYIILVKNYGKKISFISFASYFNAAIMFISNFFAAKYISTSDFGLWKKVGIIGSYLIFSQMGVFNANLREIPANLKKNKISDYVKNIEVGQWFGTFPPIIITAFFYFYLQVVEQESSLVLLLLVIYYPLLQYTNFLRNLLIARKEIIYISKTILFTTLLVVIAIPFYAKLGFVFILTSLNAYVGFQIILFLRKCKIPFKINLDINYAKKLIYIGFPILISNILFQLISTFDRILILSFYSNEVFAQYAFSSLIFSFLLMIPSSFSNVFYPKMIETSIEFDGKKLLRNLNVKIDIFSTLVMLICYLTLLKVLPFLINSFLPNYQSSVEPFYILGLSAVILGTSTISCGNTLIIFNKQKLVLLSLIFGVIVTIFSCFILLSYGYSLIGVALGNIFGMSVYIIFLRIFYYRTILN